MTQTVILKFGGAAVETATHFSAVAELILLQLTRYNRVVTVVSAMGKTTDALVSLAREVHPSPPCREYDMLVSTGERISMALLAMALCLKGKEAVSFTGSQSGILTCRGHTEARIVTVKPWRIEEALDQGKVAIVAGFQGMSDAREITTLGRGGSDTSAVALGIALKAERVIFFKDVPGIFDTDPKKNAEAKYYDQLTYKEANAILEQGARVLHPRALLLAEQNGLLLQVQSFIPALSHQYTLIGDPTLPRREEPLYEFPFPS